MKETFQELILSEKVFLSALEAHLSNGHQQTFIYDFLVNSAVDFSKSGTRHLSSNIHYFYWIIFLELMEEQSQYFHEIERCDFPTKSIE